MPNDETAITVLAVDDEAVILLGLASLLEDLGYTVKTARNSREALEIIEQDSSIKAIVTDHSMPGLSGVEMIAQIDSLRPIAAVLSTAHVDLAPGPGDRWVRIFKPFSSEELADALKVALANMRVA